MVDFLLGWATVVFFYHVLKYNYFLFIFHYILRDKLIFSNYGFLQITTLISLKLLTHTGSSAMFQGVPKYRCNASYDLVKSLSR